MDNLIVGIIFGAVFLFIGICIVVHFIQEKRLWNCGICKETGDPWESFAMDSGGCIGYESHDHTIWVSHTWKFKGD